MEVKEKKPFEYSKSRFEFELKINENIICQRKFDILGFNGKCKNSLELTHAISDAASVIDEDLKSKSRMYLWYYYTPESENEFNDNVFKGVGEGYKAQGGVYDKPQDVDGVKTYLPEVSSVFNLSFKMDGKPVVTKMWSGDNYPLFIRNNVDITNKRYLDSEDARLSYDNQFLKRVHSTKQDLVRVIIDILTNACTLNSFTSMK